MKKLLLTILLISLIPKILHSQYIDTTYYDNQWNPITSKNYKFYRIAKYDSNIVQVQDYYKSGQIQMTGAFKNKDFSYETGPFYYYKKNRISHLQIYEPSKFPEITKKFSEQFKYLISLPDSFTLNVFYKKNGHIKSIGYRFNTCINEGVWLFYFENGEFPSYLVDYHNGDYNGRHIMYDKHGLPAISGNYRFGKKHGAWEWSKDGKVFLTDYWIDGKKIKTIR